MKCKILIQRIDVSVGNNCRHSTVTKKGPKYTPPNYLKLFDYSLRFLLKYVFKNIFPTNGYKIKKNNLILSLNYSKYDHFALHLKLGANAISCKDLNKNLY